MNYNEDWREERHRNRQDSDYNPRWETAGGNNRSERSQYRNNSEFATPNSGSIDRSSRNRNDRPWQEFDQDGRNPNWDNSAPSSSRYESNDQYQNRNEEYRGRYNERNENFGNSFEGNDYGNYPNNNYSAQGMSDPRYGNPKFSDRQRRGSNGGSSDRYERGNYGNYPDYRSSGREFSNAPQGRYGSHTEGWNNNEDTRLDRSLGRRDNDSYSQPSHRGKGPQNYKRSDSRIKEDINDALTDHHNIDASNIDVEVKEGVVILSGKVNNRNEKRGAESAIDYISGVHNVENRLHVNSSSSVSSKDSNSNWSGGSSQTEDINGSSSSSSNKSKNSKTTA